MYKLSLKGRKKRLQMIKDLYVDTFLMSSSENRIYEWTINNTKEGLLPLIQKETIIKTSRDSNSIQLKYLRPAARGAVMARVSRIEGLMVKLIAILVLTVATSAAETCSEGYYYNSSQQQCTLCEMNGCQMCPNGTGCNKCFSSLFMNSNKVCEYCHSKCATCSGSKANQCLTCYSGFVLNPSTKTCETPQPTLTSTNLILLVLGAAAAFLCLITMVYCLIRTKCFGVCLRSQLYLQSSEQIQLTPHPLVGASGNVNIPSRNPNSNINGARIPIQTISLIGANNHQNQTTPPPIQTISITNGVEVRTPRSQEAPSPKVYFSSQTTIDIGTKGRSQRVIDGDRRPSLNEQLNQSNSRAYRPPSFSSNIDNSHLENNAPDIVNTSLVQIMEGNEAEVAERQSA